MGTLYGCIAWSGITTVSLSSSVVFAGFSAESLMNRINDGKVYFELSVIFHGLSCISLTMYVLSLPASVSVVVTADEAVRGGKTIPLKSIVDEAVEGCQCVQRVFVSRRTGADVPITQRDLQLDQVSAASSAPC